MCCFYCVIGYKKEWSGSGYKKEWSGSGYKKEWSGSGYKKEWSGSGYKKEWSGSGYKKEWSGSGYKKEWSGSGYKKEWSGSGYKKEWSGSGYKKEWSGERVQERMERERVQERMEREWSKFLETVKTLADGTEQVEFRKLTHHHHFNYQGKDTVILGEDRMKHIELVVSDIKAFQEAKQRFLEAKENHPIYCVVAAPRQGKSLLLDVLCSSIRYTGTLAVSIIYNSSTPYTEKDSSLLTCAPRFWARVVYTIANAFGANLGWLPFQNSSFISLLTLNRVLELVNMCLPQYSNKGIVVAADEFSEVVKGFVVKDLQLLMTAASSRPLAMLWLNPAVQSTREQYYPILEELKKRYPKAESHNAQSHLPHTLYSPTGPTCC
ncbi:hypothetical protein EMCRGX_G011092 [Ephydatia muelleri]